MQVMQIMNFCRLVFIKIRESCLEGPSPLSAKPIWGPLERGPVQCMHLKSSQIFSNPLRCSQILSNPLRSSQIPSLFIRKIPGQARDFFDKKWWDLIGSERIWQDLRGFEKIWEHLRGFEKIWEDLRCMYCSGPLSSGPIVCFADWELYECFRRKPGWRFTAGVELPILTTNDFWIFWPPNSNIGQVLQIRFGYK